MQTIVYIWLYRASPAKNQPRAPCMVDKGAAMNMLATLRDGMILVLFTLAMLLLTMVGGTGLNLLLG